MFTQVNLLFRVTDDPDIDSELSTGFSIDAGQNQAGPGLASEFFDFAVASSPLNDLFTAVLPLGPGSFEMLGGSIAASESWTLHYEWNLVVEPAASVPEPGAIALLGIAVPVVRSLHQRSRADRRRRG